MTGDHDPVIYDLTQWPAESRDALRQLLADAAIDARWVSSSFAVPAASRGDVDALVASLNGTAGAGPALHRATATQTLPAPGWYPDPMREALWRWWDGQRWTGYVGPQLPPRDRGWFPPKNDREQTARGGGLAIAGFVVGQALSLGVVGLAILLGASSRSAVTLFVGELALWTGLFGACKLAVRRYGTGSLRDLGLVRPELGDLGIGSLAALVARIGTLIIAVILVLMFSFDDLTRDTSVTNESGISTLGAIVVVIVAVFGAPFFEELFFRGLVQGVLTRRYGGRVAICTQAVAFGLVHYQIGMTRGQVILTFSMIIPVGFLLGCIRWRYQRLGPGMVAHAVFNAIAVAITFATL